VIMEKISMAPVPIMEDFQEDHHRQERGGEESSTVSKLHEDDPLKYNKVYARRWAVFGVLTCLIFSIDWVGYSISPVAGMVEQVYAGSLSQSMAVEMFLVGSVLVGVFVPFLLHRSGLRMCVIFGASLLTVGNLVKILGLCWHRSMFSDEDSNWNVHVAVFAAYTGAFLSGGSQTTCLICTLNAVTAWFPAAEVESTLGFMISAGQLGIGFSYGAGKYFLNEQYADPAHNLTMNYFYVLLFVSLTTLVLATLFMGDRPPTPPSHAALALRKKQEKAVSLLDTWHQAGAVLLVPGFAHSLVFMFVGVICIVILSTYIDEIFEAVGYTDSDVAWEGVGVMIIALCFASLVGGFLTWTKWYRPVITVVLVGIIVSTAMMAWCIPYNWVVDMKCAILFVGAFAGPLRAAAAALGSEVAYPTDESTIMMNHVLISNLGAAFVVHMFDALVNMGPYAYLYSILLVTCLACVGLAFAYKFDGELNKTIFESSSAGSAKQLESPTKSSLPHQLGTLLDLHTVVGGRYSDTAAQNKRAV